MEKLREKLKVEFGAQADILDVICSMFEVAHLKKGEVFVRSGAYCKQMAFIENGLMRVFALYEDKEVTQWISKEEEYVADLASFLFNVPSRWSIEALTDCTVYTLTRSKYDEMGNLIPEWPDIEKGFWAHCFTNLENRVFQFISLNAEERYRQYIEHNGDIAARVPQQHIASMLGMTPETLSRVRRKIIS